MDKQCIFFRPGHSPTCQVLEALALVDGLPTKEERAVLRDNQFCTGGRFAECRLFTSAERGLAAKQLRLGKHVTTTDPTATSLEGECNGTMC